jgi:hypothetical protein
MSYDLWSFPVASGEDPLVVAQRLQAAEEGESTPGDADPAMEARKKALADAIIAQNPEMKPFALQYDQIAEMEKITVEEAKKRFRYIELDAGEGGNGIQITLYDVCATVTAPYWHQGEKAEVVFREMWEYLQILHKRGGFVTYDPQLERMLCLDRDLQDAVQRYAGVVRQVKGPSPGNAKGSKPWWKFW